ncbi:MAG: TlpA disulfide reductase family protein [Pyrinomonadaceae bacterium]
MMRAIFSNLVLFVVFSMAFSALTACSDTANSQQSSDSLSSTEGPASDTSAGAARKSKSSEYPPIASAVATASLKNLDGSTFTINDKKGKVILLNMWATWCGPCRAEMPSLVQMHEQHQDKGFEVIGLNTDNEPIAQIEKFAADMKLNYPLVWIDSATQNELVKISRFGGIPQSFIVDREGHLRGVFRGANPKDIEHMKALVAEVVSE